jgi:hypothetical protein
MKLTRYYYAAIVVCLLLVAGAPLLSKAQSGASICNDTSLRTLLRNSSGRIRLNASTVNPNASVTAMADLFINDGFATPCKKEGDLDFIFVYQGSSSGSLVEYRQSASVLTASGQFGGFTATDSRNYSELAGAQGDSPAVQVAVYATPAGRSLVVDDQYAVGSGATIQVETDGADPDFEDDDSDGDFEDDPTSTGGSDKGNQNTNSNNQSNTKTSTNNSGSPDSASDRLINPLGAKSLIELFFKVLKMVLLLLGAITVAVIILGGFQLVVSRGSVEGITKGKKTIIWAVIGLAVALLSYSIVSITQFLLGVK